MEEVIPYGIFRIDPNVPDDPRPSDEEWSANFVGKREDFTRSVAHDCELDFAVMKRDNEPLTVEMNTRYDTLCVHVRGSHVVKAWIYRRPDSPWKE